MGFLKVLKDLVVSEGIIQEPKIEKDFLQKDF